MEIITKWQKWIEEIKKIFSSRTTGLNSTKLGAKPSWMKGNSSFSNEGPLPFEREDNYETAKCKNLLQNHWANFNKTWHKASLGEQN